MRRWRAAVGCGVVAVVVVAAALPTRSQALHAVGSFQLVSEVRVTRTVSEFTYRAVLTNAGPAVGGATATVASLSPNTTVVDGTVTFAATGANGSTVSTDTFSFRHNRTVPFAWSNLTWSIAVAAPPPGEGVLLQGGASSDALSALVSKMAEPARNEDIVKHVLLTRLDVALEAGATVGQVNTALAAVGGGIIGMRPLTPVVVVGVPRQADAAALQALADTLSEMPGIRKAFIGRSAAPDLAPPAPANESNFMEHLQDARFPAAWNVRTLAGNCSDRVFVLVVDHFHRPPLAGYSDFNQEVPGIVELGTGSVAADQVGKGRHGYDVTATLAARLDQFSPTGANPFPECLALRALQANGLSDYATSLAIEAALPAAGKVVLNASLGWTDACPVDEPCHPDTIDVLKAVDRGFLGAMHRWLFRAVEDRVLMTIAAGNEAGKEATDIYPGAGFAPVGWAPSVAAKADGFMSFVLDENLWEPRRFGFPSLTATAAEWADLQDHLADVALTGAPAAANVTLVGSTDPIQNLRSPFSDHGSDVSAVGQNLPRYHPDLPVMSGTSYAAPQVAGLVSFLWMLSPDLRARPVADTIQAITANVRGAANQIDAFATVLSLDPDGSPDPVTWLVRRTLLDVDEDGAFTEADVTAFVSRYFEADFVTPVQPAARDYGRHDLNGDGFTGGSGRESFDLHRAGSTPYGAPLLGSVMVDVGAERFTLEEGSVSDLQILCYYAYSELFTGIAADRDRLLGERCVPLSVTVAPSSTAVVPGGTVALAATVHGSTDQRVTWELAGGGGSIDDAGVFTAGDAPGTYVVRGRSVVDPHAVGTASVTVVNPGSTILSGHVTATLAVTFVNAGFYGYSRDFTAKVEVLANGELAGVLSATGTGSLTERCHWTGPITGGRIEARSPWDGRENLRFFTTKLLTSPEPECAPTAAGGLALYGFPVRDGSGRVTSIDFAYSESYSPPVGNGSYMQTGALRP